MKRLDKIRKGKLSNVVLPPAKRPKPVKKLLKRVEEAKAQSLIENK